MTSLGRVLTAMVTAMRPDGSLDLDGVGKVADHLVRHGHDGIVVFGTTGEASTLCDDEKLQVLRAAREAVGDGICLVAGAGTNDTAHSVELARRCAQAGADAILAVTPYYNLPTQDGLVAHFRAVADATELPVMLYDIPHRSGRPLTVDTLRTLSEHPRIVAVKDAKGDLWAMTKLLATTGLQWYSGSDELNLPMLALGARGVVSVVGHLAGDDYRSMVEAVAAGDLQTARRLHRELVPLVDAVMGTSQGAIMVKAALVELGVLDSAAVRLPYVESPPEHLGILRAALATRPTA